MKCGLGIRSELFEPISRALPDLGFLEAHSENFFGDSSALQRLLQLRDRYPISLHGVGLSLGRADDLDDQHLSQLKHLVSTIEPLFVSEHLAWSAYAHQHVPDLLPLPLTDQALTVMCEHIDRMQTALGRAILLENPSNYLAFDQLQIPEPEFLNELAQRTGCALLVDINNVYVSAFNLRRDPHAFLQQLDSSRIAQFHLAGHTEVKRDFGADVEPLLIDTHDHCVAEQVWTLFERAISIHGTKPTLLEWDSNFPELDVLVGECDKANQKLNEAKESNVLTAKNTDESSASASPTAARRSDAAPGLAGFQAQFLQDLLGLETKHKNAVSADQGRISVYQNNVYGALQDYLVSVYPATQGVLGPAFFKQTMQMLIQSYPPSEGNLHRYGGELRQIIETVPGLEGLPYLTDLVRYEWALHECHYSEFGADFDPSNVAQEVMLTMPIQLRQSAALIVSEYPVLEIHRQSLPDYQNEVRVDLNQGGDHILVHKAVDTVKTLSLTGATAQLIAAIQKNQNLVQAIEALSGSIDPNALTNALSFLFENRLLTTPEEAQKNPKQTRCVKSEIYRNNN